MTADHSSLSAYAIDEERKRQAEIEMIKVQKCAHFLSLIPKNNSQGS